MKNAGIKKSVMPYVAKALSSDTVMHGRRRAFEIKRRLLSQPHELHIFLRVDDPYSYLLVQALPKLLARFNVKPVYHTIYHYQQDMFPDLELWHRNAARDAYHLAKLYGLQFEAGTRVTNSDWIQHATATLLASEGRQDYLQTAQVVFSELWRLSPSPLHTDARFPDADLQSRLRANENLLQRKGHYFSAMIDYAGEWYWGIDRLDHLEQRLIDLGAAYEKQEAVYFNRTYCDFCTKKVAIPAKTDEALTLYWSARSPYSHIGLERAVQLAEFHQIPLEIKPVLPMMMRDMYVPPAKTLYIFLDTKREARKLNIDYGFVADPLGEAVERCYALWRYAQARQRGTAYLLSFARAVNAEGIRAETDAGMKTIVERCGLSWAEATPLLADQSWRQWAQANLEDMYQLGCWGVPSFQYRDAVFWGQDRIGLIEQAVLGDFDKG